MENLLETLDALALALAEEGHKWTKEERKLYEATVKWLTDRIRGTELYRDYTHVKV